VPLGREELEMGKRKNKKKRATTKSDKKKRVKSDNALLREFLRQPFANSKSNAHGDGYDVPGVTSIEAETTDTRVSRRTPRE
jgi:hypothetical protein